MEGCNYAGEGKVRDNITITLEQSDTSVSTPLIDKITSRLANVTSRSSAPRKSIQSNGWAYDHNHYGMGVRIGCQLSHSDLILCPDLTMRGRSNKVLI
jgi:hypothetical protein